MPIDETNRLIVTALGEGLYTIEHHPSHPITKTSLDLLWTMANIMGSSREVKGCIIHLPHRVNSVVLERDDEFRQAWTTAIQSIMDCARSNEMRVIFTASDHAIFDLVLPLLAACSWAGTAVRAGSDWLDLIVWNLQHPDTLPPASTS